MIKLDVAALQRPIQTMEEKDNCGDATLIIEHASSLFLAIFDGSGHGRAAQETAHKTMKFLTQGYEQDLGELLLSLHQTLKGTVGGVCGLCRIDKQSAQMTCAGIGNVSINLYNSGTKRFTPRGGVLGDEIVAPLIEQATMAPNQVLMLYTDGIEDHLRPKDFPDFFKLSASDIARITIDYFSKPLDDAAVIVVKVRDD